MNMPWGKYCGMDIAQMVRVDPDYAEWLLDQEWLKDHLREIIEDAVNHRPTREELEAQLETLREKLSSSALAQQTTSIGFSQTEIMNLIKLCHPDRHDNSELANIMTRKLLDLRGR